METQFTIDELKYPRESFLIMKAFLSTHMFMIIKLSDDTKIRKRQDSQL